MALTETQIQGHKKRPHLIYEKDLARVMPAFGLREVQGDGMGTRFFKMKITEDWDANVEALEVTIERMPTSYRLRFYVTKVDGGAKMGTVHQVVDATHLQLHGAKIMAHMFESVDDLTPYQCGECETGLLSWDGRTPRKGRVGKPGMACSSCGWRGLTGTFRPLKEFT